MSVLAYKHFEAEQFVEHFQVSEKIRSFFQRMAQIRDLRRRIFDLPRKSATGESPSFSMYMDRVHPHSSRKWA